MLKEHIEMANKLAIQRDDIATQEQELRKELETLDLAKETLEHAILAKEQELEELYNQDKTIKEYSNADKRNAKAQTDLNIINLKNNTKELIKKTDSMKINIKCKLDQWKLQLELIRHW